MDALPQELVLGLVTPVGTDVDGVTTVLVKALQVRCHYSVNVVRVSELIEHFSTTPAPSAPELEDRRVTRLIAAGNELCISHRDPAAVAQLAIAEIRRIRMALTGDPSPAGTRQAFIVRTLKRPAEVELLRKTYGPQFLLLAAQDPESARIEQLASRNLSSVDEADRYRIARDLSRIDADESGEKYGQHVNKVFAEADYFLSAGDKDAERLLKLIWGDSSIAPEPSEYAMYAAHAASARSLSASRRVGAALVREGRLISTGFNDVPAGEPPDIAEGRDASEIYKRDLLRDTLRLLQPQLGFDVRHLEGQGFDDVLKSLNGSMIQSVIEGQRAVHAEAAAIDDAARRGVAVDGATLYTTTFPCHLCFKAVLGVGIREVRYVHPYPKSRASEMFPTSVGRLQPYEGVAPRAFLRFFLERRVPVADSAGNLPRRVLDQEPPFQEDAPRLDRHLVDLNESRATQAFVEASQTGGANE